MEILIVSVAIDLGSDNGFVTAFLIRLRRLSQVDTTIG